MLKFSDVEIPTEEKTIKVPGVEVTPTVERLNNTHKFQTKKNARLHLVQGAVF